jgi:hypothetical protein
MSDNQKAHDIATTVAWMRAEIERLRARVEVLEKHLGLMIANNLAGSFESEGLATDRAIAVLPDWLEKANGYTRAELDAAAEIVNLRVEEAKP